MQSLDKRKISMLSAYAVTLNLIERFIPTPLPWLRFGFANIITLMTIFLYGTRIGLMVTLVRVFTVSLITGTFLGPGFLLSLSGGVLSTVGMGVSRTLGGRLFSPLGLSLIGAFLHNIAQLSIAYIFFVKRIELILYISSFIIFIGIITGFLNGIVCLLLIKKLQPPVI